MANTEWIHWKILYQWTLKTTSIFPCRYLTDSAEYADSFIRNTFSISERQGETTLPEEMFEGEDKDEKILEEMDGWKKKEDGGEKKVDSGRLKNKMNKRKQRLLSYLEAGNHGRQHGNCWSVFPQCPISFSDLFTSQQDPVDSFQDPTESWYDNIRSS